MNPEATELLAGFVAVAEDPALKTQARWTRRKWL